MERPQARHLAAVPRSCSSPAPPLPPLSAWDVLCRPSASPWQTASLQVCADAAIKGSAAVACGCRLRRGPTLLRSRPSPPLHRAGSLATRRPQVSPSGWMESCRSAALCSSRRRAFGAGTWRRARGWGEGGPGITACQRCRASPCMARPYRRRTRRPASRAAAQVSAVLFPGPAFCPQCPESLEPGTCSFRSPLAAASTCIRTPECRALVVFPNGACGGIRMSRCASALPAACRLNCLLGPDVARPGGCSLCPAGAATRRLSLPPSFWHARAGTDGCSTEPVAMLKSAGLNPADAFVSDGVYTLQVIKYQAEEVGSFSFLVPTSLKYQAVGARSERLWGMAHKKARGIAPERVCAGRQRLQRSCPASQHRPRLFPFATHPRRRARFG